jgi:hypothetical protein
MRYEVTIAYETLAGDIKVATFPEIDADPKMVIPTAAKRAHAADPEYRTIISGHAKPNHAFVALDALKAKALADKTNEHEVRRGALMIVWDGDFEFYDLTQTTNSAQQITEQQAADLLEEIEAEEARDAEIAARERGLDQILDHAAVA